MNRRHSCAAAVLLLAGCSGRAADSEARPLATDSLRTAIAPIIERAGGTVGIAAAEVNGSTALAVNGDARFPMMSVYKVPIGIVTLRAVGRGELALSDRVRFGASDYRPGRSPLSSEHPSGGVDVTVSRLLQLAVTESDNAASDILLRLVGGGSAATAELRALGIDGIRIDRSEGEMALQYFGGDSTVPSERWTRAFWTRVTDSAAPAARAEGAKRYLEDPRDTATPVGMAALLSRLVRGELVDSAGTRLLLELMRNPAGQRRLRSAVDSGVVVASKTGTAATTGGITAAINDTGILRLPDGRLLAVAVFVKGSDRSPEEVSAAIGEIALELYRRWPRAAGD